MLGKEKRISRSCEYNTVYQQGRKTPGRYIIVFVIPNLTDHNRFGFVTSKKVGKAGTRPGDNYGQLFKLNGIRLNPVMILS